MVAFQVAEQTMATFLKNEAGQNWVQPKNFLVLVLAALLL